MGPFLLKRLTGEFLGTAMLLATVVGSGIMAERLADGNAAVALLANTIATGAALFALILSLSDVSGAHFNPAVTVTEVIGGNLSVRDAVGYLAAQFAGAFVGVVIANAMFSVPSVTINGGSLTRVTSRPLSKPKAVVTARPQSMAT